MKHGYTCTCGWRLNRGALTRHEYARLKAAHAGKIITRDGQEIDTGCPSLRKELEQSRKIAAK